MPNLLGTAPNQVPTNADLGKLAFMDVVDTVTNNPYLDTAISDTKPSLLLDFANSKTLDPRITYTRASTASYYDGKTTAVAEQNLLTYSQDFDNGIWLKGAASITANTTTAPDGTSTADSFIGDGTTSARYMDQVQAANPNGRTYSVYAKAGTNNYIQLAFSADPNAWANFDLSLGTVGSVGTNQTASIVSAGNGWYRCIIYTSSNTAANIRHFLISSSTAIRSESNSLSTYVYLWGAQLEQRSSVSSYTPTTSSPITNYIPALQTAAAGVPRFDHDPVTGESKGFLIEEQRSNLLTYSEQFDNAAWSKLNSSVTVDSVISPNGNLSADTLLETTANGQHNISVQNTATGTKTFSVYAKQAVGTRFLRLIDYNATNSAQGETYFNLINGTVASGSGSIQSVGNGWYRCSITTTTTVTSGYYISLASAVGTFNYTGDGYSGIYIWGAQLEAGSFATSYIPTTSAQVTRSADAASITGGNFSSWYRADEGTLYAETSLYSLSGRAAAIIDINDGSTNNRTVLRALTTGGADQVVIRSGSATVASISTAVNPTLALRKAGVVYKVNDFAINANGGALSIDTDGAVPAAPTQVLIGYASGPTEYLGGTIKKLAYYPKRLSDAELQEMTL